MFQFDDEGKWAERSYPGESRKPSIGEWLHENPAAAVAVILLLVGLWRHVSGWIMRLVGSAVQ